MFQKKRVLENKKIGVRFLIGDPLPPSPPRDFSVLPMGLRVKIEKFMIILHFQSLDENTLVRRDYEEQRRKNWPWSAAETEIICQELQIEECNITTLSKPQYRILVIQACHLMNEKILLTQANGKCDRLNQENYGKNEYIFFKNIFGVRKQYRARFGLESFAGNYSHDKRFAKTSWLCLCQKSREEEVHLLSGQCQVYGDLIEKYSDLTEDDQLVQFFGDVLARRDALETLGGGDITTAGANPDPGDEDEAIQGSHLFGSTQL